MAALSQVRSLVALARLKTAKVACSVLPTSIYRIDLEFNPEEFILVSASADKTLRFWDVQEFALIGLTPTDNATVSGIARGGIDSGVDRLKLCCLSHCRQPPCAIPLPSRTAASICFAARQKQCAFGHTRLRSSVTTASCVRVRKRLALWKPMQTRRCCKT